MGIWGFYFLIKIILFYTGYIHFHFFVNTAFALALIFSHARPVLLRIRKWVALPIGIVLLYFDSPLPPLRNIIPKIGQLLDFSYQYYLELLTRILDWRVMVILLALYLAYYLLSKKLRMTTIAFLAILSTALPLGMNTSPLTYDADGQVIGLPSDIELTESLDGFFVEESLRSGFNRSQRASGPAFDILVSISAHWLGTTLNTLRKITTHYSSAFITYLQTSIQPLPIAGHQLFAYCVQAEANKINETSTRRQ